MEGMIIIRKGILPANQQYSGTCNHCGAMVRFLKKEAKVKSHGNPNLTHLIQVACPTEGCGHMIKGTPILLPDE